MKNECCIQFSGGSDSTLVAFLAAKKYDITHLLTFEHYGMKNIFYSKKNLYILKKRFPNKTFVHHIIDINKIYCKVYSNKHFRNIFKYNLLLIYNISGASKFSMHIRTILYCLENNINYAYDGANQEYENIDPAQTSYILPLIKKLYNHYGIHFENLIYYNHYSSRSDERLFKEGIFNYDKIKEDKNKTFNIQPYNTNNSLTALFLRRVIKNQDRHYLNKIRKKLYVFYKEQLTYYIKYINNHYINKSNLK